MGIESTLQQIAIAAPPLLFSITCHEVSHGYVAYRFGDPTAKSAGRLTLNPLKHLDPLGLLVFVITRFIGWAKPVPVNPWNFKNPRKDMMWVALAGPVTNILLALVFALPFRLLLMYDPLLSSSLFAFFNTGVLPPLSGLQTVYAPLFLMLGVGIIINVALAAFNLLPIPPLDGGRIMAGILPQRFSQGFGKLEPYGLIIIVAFLLFGGFDLLTPFVWKTVLFLMGGF
jgi:Zn-dependent protease